MSLVSKDQKKIHFNEQLDFIELGQEDWRLKEFSNPNATIKVATLFSRIGAIEHSLKRLNLRHEIIFAGDIDKNCKASELAP